MSDQPPIRKTQARSQAREHARRQAERHDSIIHALPFVIGAAVVLFVGIAVFFATNSSSQTVQGTTGARLQVDQEKIDLGNRIFNQPVRAMFKVKNVGDGTLKLETPKIANVLEGC